MNENLPAGWAFPTAAARKEHWFAAGNPRSGCGGYGRILVDVRPDAPSARFTCAACKRKADQA